METTTTLHKHPTRLESQVIRLPFLLLLLKKLPPKRKSEIGDDACAKAADRAAHFEKGSEEKEKRVELQQRARHTPKERVRVWRNEIE